MNDINSFFNTLMDSFMHPSKPIAVFPMASDTYLMTEKDHDDDDHENDHDVQKDHREYYID